MDKYEQYKQELIEMVVRRQIDAFGLVDYIIELCEKIDYLDEKLNNKIDFDGVNSKQELANLVYERLKDSGVVRGKSKPNDGRYSTILKKKNG